MSTTESKQTEEEKRQPGFFSKLILLGILPLLYSIGLGMVVLHFSGIDFQTQVKWVEDHTKPLFAMKQKLAKAKETNDKSTASATKGDGSDSKTSSAATNSGISANNTAAATTNTGSSATSTAENTEKTKAVENNTAPETNGDESTKTSVVADSLASMDPKDAAKMLSNMPEAEAVKNLKLLERDVQTAIIAEMPGEEGARLAIALDKGEEAETTTNSSVQLYQYMSPDQIASILRGISDRAEVLKQIKQLDPKTASKVVSQLDPQVSGWLVSQMN
ncbi:hypothetical protein J7E81_21560 [Bacillus sp. ISL-18]|uniref:hypothetical protein n=1 Tax=Bacillus sp. ISL-18 TaxID=2819118 RepID=UPI001BE965A4|nr:hypothetical protein [Bacillus sp. ISL-18]MBT2657792.1 hypothetical protein [Bacillus sp. ISL-18]